jgi:hypothetical protein
MVRATILVMLIMALGATAHAQGNPRNAVMAAQRVGPAQPGKVVSKSRQPVGTPHKASSFAPHKTNKRVFGDPIQAPIMHSHPAPKRK